MACRQVGLRGEKMKKVNGILRRGNRDSNVLLFIFQRDSFKEGNGEGGNDSAKLMTDCLMGLKICILFRTQKLYLSFK